MGDEYLHGHHESVLRSHSWRTAENSAAYLLPRLRPGLSLLDVGCGPGTITADLAAVVAPGRVVGLEAAPEVLVAAGENAEAAGVAHRISFEEGDVYALPYDDDSFDVVHAHQVLQHLSDPIAALREMRRVCRPGGVVAARDVDYGAIAFFPAISGIQQWQRVYRDTAYAGGCHPDAGRMLKSWALAVGFEDVASSGSVWCYASDDEVQWWSQLWADRVIHSDFATQAVERGLADDARLREIQCAWREWGSAPDAWILLPHGEILCRA
ncbi:class I SAM-dependent methyltransferase [Blastococcus sp. Marseille-P5729]|uniref:class I SAM-dependent methyltransferase n=1 Tax=Blastococcus sp. Marseille-P5729 TaxID=2086582 RepID=UPI000D0E6026|nr:methyltransferase domain-containing protein [Blastococcus sp. Marseille-P5729]